MLLRNGQIAIEKVEQNDYNLILMDLQMPVMDGFTATSKIRELNDSRKSTLPVIALTASALIDMKDKAYETGMDGYITKPFNPKELYDKVAQYSKAS